MRFSKIIEDISNAFNDTWNNWEIQEMGNFLTEDIEVHSPKVLLVDPNNKLALIRGKSKVLDYWKKLAEITGKFKVAKLHSLKLERDVINYNEILDTDIVIKETLKLNEYGKIFYLKYEYLNKNELASDLEK